MLFILLSVSLIACAFSAPVNEENKSIKTCKQRVVGDYSNPGNPEAVDIPDNCTEGVVNFHHTTNNIDLVFRRKGVYIVCISSNARADGELYSIRDQTGTRDAYLGLPSKQRQVCTFTAKGDLKLRIEPKMLTFVLQVPYKIYDIKLRL